MTSTPGIDLDTDAPPSIEPSMGPSTSSDPTGAVGALYVNVE